VKWHERHHKDDDGAEAVRVLRSGQLGPGERDHCSRLVPRLQKELLGLGSR
jgi:hypothetical protein